MPAKPQSLDRTAAEQFLKFYLHPDTRLMLPITQITEVLKIQFGHIVPLPQMPSWIMGVYNWRGDILWMVDLADLLGLEPWYRHSPRSHHTAVVLSPNRERRDRSSNAHLGLVVSSIEDLVACEVGAIQSALGLRINARLGSFLQGYWLEPGGEAILALDGKAIAAAMPQNSAD